MVLFVMLVVSLVSVVTYVQTAQRNAFYIDEANRIARSKIVTISTTPAANLSNGTTESSGGPEMTQLPPGSVVKVTISTPSFATESKQVDVEVRWVVGDIERKVRLTSYVGPEGGGA